jgi:hypothetical protein
MFFGFVNPKEYSEKIIQDQWKKKKDQPSWNSKGLVFNSHLSKDARKDDFRRQWNI